MIVNIIAILLHELHKHQHSNLPHKIIIEEEEDDDDDLDDVIETPMTIIRERESYVHSPELVQIAHHHHHRPSSTPMFSNQINGQIGSGGSPILVHLVAPNIRRKHDNSIPDLLAVLAPLAAIPLIGSLAVSSFTTMLTLTGLGRRRRRKRDLSIHDKVLNFLNSSTQTFDDIHHNDPNNYSNANRSSLNIPLNNNNTWNGNQTRIVPITELFQLDIVQQYL
ncbi:hypothetical protein BLA29_009369, partial [Euroglyphus maynei]